MPLITITSSALDCDSSLGTSVGSRTTSGEDSRTSSVIKNCDVSSVEQHFMSFNEDNFWYGAPSEGKEEAPKEEEFRGVTRPLSSYSLDLKYDDIFGGEPSLGQQEGKERVEEKKERKGGKGGTQPKVGGLTQALHCCMEIN